MPPADRAPPMPEAINDLVRVQMEVPHADRASVIVGGRVMCVGGAVDALDIANHIRTALAEVHATGRDDGLEEAAEIASDNGSLDIYGKPLAPFLRSRKRPTTLCASGEKASEAMSDELPKELVDAITEYGLRCSSNVSVEGVYAARYALKMRIERFRNDAVRAAVESALANDLVRRAAAEYEARFSKHGHPFFAANEALCDAHAALLAAVRSATAPPAETKIQQIDDPETSTRICPCGAMFAWSGISDDLAPWMQQHAAHESPRDAPPAEDTTKP